ncbi:hypothetical protein QQ999_09490 [Pseudomonas fluorescens]
MANEHQPKLRIVKTGGTKVLSVSMMIAGNQYFPGLPASCQLLPKLRFLRIADQLLLCVKTPGESEFKPVSMTAYSAKAVLTPVSVETLAQTDDVELGKPWPHTVQIDMQSLDARSLRGIMELAQDPLEFPPDTEEIVERAFQASLKQSIDKRAFWELVRSECRAVGIKAPPHRLVARRLDCLFSREVLRYHPLTRQGHGSHSEGFPSE